jgi:predicted ATP-grasp superfamily ATP-dependent carboligase
LTTNVHRILITGGRAPAALELARLLSSAGYEVYTADSIDHYLCRLSRSITRSFLVPKPNEDFVGFIEELETILKEFHIDLLIPTCEEVLYIAQGLDKLERVCQVLSPPFSQLEKLHNKWEFIQKAQSYGFTTPSTELVTGKERWHELAAAAEASKEALVLKPVYSRFASKVCIFGVTPTRAAASFLSRYEPEISTNYPWVAQQFISGRAICTYSIAQYGRLTAHAAYSSSYTAGRGACVYFEPIDHSKAMEWVEQFVQFESYTGQISFDFIEAEDGSLFPIECNPRATSGIHLFHSNNQLHQAFMPICNGREDKILQPHQNTRAMLALPMLSFGLSTDLTWIGVKRWLRSFMSAKDVIFRWSDPLPFLEQLPMLIKLKQISRSRHISLIEASTADIEWNGGT